MNDWNPHLYLKFRNERTQPSIDLVNRIELDFDPEHIIDIGCGPGNSSQVLAQRWPHSQLTGLDSSASMIEKARADYPDQNWILGDAAAFQSNEKYDLIFSNATIQWIPDHQKLIAHLSSLLTDRGCLAVQLPMFWNMELGKVIDETGEDERWADRVADVYDLFTMEDYTDYYDYLAPHFNRVDLWETSYMHVMDSHEAILEMIRSTGLRPYLERLRDDAERAAFEDEVLEGIRIVYPVQDDGKVILPFIRLFFAGYRG